MIKKKKSSVNVKATSQRVGATANPFHDAEKLHTIEETLTCSWAISSEICRATRNGRQVSPLRKNKKIKSSSVLNCFLFSEIKKKKTKRRGKRGCVQSNERGFTHTRTHAVYTSVA